MTSGGNGSKVSKSIRGRHTYLVRTYTKTSMSSNDGQLSWKRFPVEPQKKGRRSMRSRIWGTKFPEIYKGCLNKYIALNDNRCKHISESQILKNSKQIENFERNANGGFWGEKKGSKSMYVQTLLGHPNLLRKAF